MTTAGDIIAGRYRIEAPIGEGGMGAVYRATHLELGRTVAVKLVRSDDPSQQALERFLREAKSAASIDHRNVVDVLDYGREQPADATDAGRARPYLVMECLAGESLEARLRRAPPPSFDEVIEWVTGALSGLAAIHDAGIVHRDLKPANVFLATDADGIVPKVLDFGIARPSQEASALTHTMQTLGTPHYMSPEQVRSAKTVDARSDIYAIGVILYLALTGKLPFDGPSATAVIAAIVTDDPTPVLELRPDVPPVLARIVHKAMARKPEDRFASARALRQALLDAQQGIDPALSADRASFTGAPTVAAAPPSGMSGSGDATPPLAMGAAPVRRTRRGFFAMLGVLSMLLVAGLAGSLVLQTRSNEAMPAMSSPTPATESAGGVASRGAAPADDDGRAPAPAAPPPVVASPTVPALPDPAASGGLGFGGAEMATAPGTLEAFASHVRGLDAATRAAVRIGSDGERYWAIAPASVASRLGDTSIEVPAGTATYAPTLMQTSVRANVRSSASESGELLATVPAQTLVLALVPDGGPERNDGDGARWTSIYVADGLVGHIATSLLTPAGGCVPDASALRDPHTWIARTTAHLPSGSRDALLLFDPRDGGEARIEAVDPSCHTEPIATFRYPVGSIADLFLTRATEDGESLLAVGRWPVRDRVPADGTMTWTVHPLSDPSRTVLQLDLRSGQNLPDARRVGIGGPEREAGTYYPLRVRERRAITYYAWDGSALVPAPRSLVAPVEPAE